MPSESLNLEVAERMLKIESVDREFAKLRKVSADSRFQFDPEKAKIKLRPYQVDAIRNLEGHLENGAPVVGLQLPTGAGKTFVIHSFLRSRATQKITGHKNILIVTPSWEIANQHAATLAQQFKGGAGCVKRLGGRGQLISHFPEFKAEQRGQIIITTSALFFARKEQWRDQLKLSYVIIDEGHHGWKKKRLNAVQMFAREIQAPCILLTATPPQNMESLPFAAQLKYLDLVPEFLVPCEIIGLHTGEEFKPVIRQGMVSQASMNELSSRSTRYETIVQESIPHLRGQVIYYAGSVSEAMGVVDAFAKRDIEAVVVHSKWAQKGDRINSLAIDQFRQGRARVLVNVQMLAMGFDVPNVETIIVARPVESDTLFTQMVGRGARPRTGKDKFVLIDVHDTIHKPEVAKIFEHKHIFYSDKDLGAVPRAKVIAALPVTLVTTLEINDLTGFPFHEGQLDDRTLVISEIEGQIPSAFGEMARAAWRR